MTAHRAGAHRTEFPEFGSTLVVDARGRADYERWNHEDPPNINPFEDEEEEDDAAPVHDLPLLTDHHGELRPTHL